MKSYVPVPVEAARQIADLAHYEWDADNDHRVGKILRYLGSPELRGYRADIDAIHDAVKEARAFWMPKPSKPDGASVRVILDCQHKYVLCRQEEERGGGYRPAVDVFECRCVRCAECRGLGQVEYDTHGYPETELETCSECGGTGLTEVCQHCMGARETEADIYDPI